MSREGRSRLATDPDLESWTGGAQETGTALGFGREHEPLPRLQQTGGKGKRSGTGSVGWRSFFEAFFGR
jgi:hypothetical protein